MNNVYQICPEFENEKYKLRFVLPEDYLDLLKVYSDKKSVPLFNSDNCGGDDFYYVTENRMKEAIHYWILEYEGKGFVRWTIVDKSTDEAVGTVELFHRDADDFYTECGLLRLDIRSDYEQAEEIENILTLITEATFDMFRCNKIATKAIPEATERICALTNMGFSASSEKLIGHDKTEYVSYFVLNKLDDKNEN